MEEETELVRKRLMKEKDDEKGKIFKKIYKYYLKIIHFFKNSIRYFQIRQRIIRNH